MLQVMDSVVPDTVYRVWTDDMLGGPERCEHFCLPSGIGDISWVVSKIWSLQQRTGKNIILHASGRDQPNRGGDFIQLLGKYFKWGGYLHDRESWEVIIQSMPPDLPARMGDGPWTNFPKIKNLSANIHLELGNTINSWHPRLPIDYHYDIWVGKYQMDTARRVMGGLTRPIFAVYVSNRAKDHLKKGGWNLWSEEEWINFLVGVGETPEVSQGSFVLIGADYDADKTQSVGDELVRRGKNVKYCVGRHLGAALCCLKLSNYFFGYPGGLGIIANVIHLPGIMLLPWYLEVLERAYADPVDMDNCRYRAWSNPKPSEVLDWFKNVGMVQALL